MARTEISRRILPLTGSVLLGALLALQPAPASAQNFFELLFGGFRKAVTPPSQPYSDPNFDGGDGGGASGAGVYCVRMCDGRHFPINYRGHQNAAEACRSFCPAAPTQVFSGGNITHAISPRGQRYSEIPNAFVYRDKIVADCTCDGKSPTGLVSQEPDDDPTLRPGDIVATSGGLKSFRGDVRERTDFTPLDRTPGLSPAMRQQLTATRVLPARTAEEMSSAPDIVPSSRNVNQRSQAAR